MKTLTPSPTKQTAYCKVECQSDALVKFTLFQLLSILYTSTAPKEQGDEKFTLKGTDCKRSLPFFLYKKKYHKHMQINSVVTELAPTNTPGGTYTPTIHNLSFTEQIWH